MSAHCLPSMDSSVARGHFLPPQMSPTAVDVSCHREPHLLPMVIVCWLWMSISARGLVYCPPDVACWPWTHPRRLPASGGHCLPLADVPHHLWTHLPPMDLLPMDVTCRPRTSPAARGCHLLPADVTCLLRTSPTLTPHSQRSPRGPPLGRLQPTYSHVHYPCARQFSPPPIWPRSIKTPP